MSPTFHVLFAYFVGFGVFFIYGVMLLLSRESMQHRAKTRVDASSLTNHSSE